MNKYIKKLMDEENVSSLIYNVQEMKKSFESDNQLLCFTHVEKQGVEHKLYTDWFDLNFTDRYIWFVYRTNQCYLTDKELMSYRYKNIKIENIKNLKVVNKLELIKKGEQIDEILEI